MHYLMCACCVLVQGGRLMSTVPAFYKGSQGLKEDVLCDPQLPGHSPGTVLALTLRLWFTSVHMTVPLSFRLPGHLHAIGLTLCTYAFTICLSSCPALAYLPFQPFVLPQQLASCRHVLHPGRRMV